MSAILSTVVVYFFDKIDLFNIKYEIRNQRIKEILEEKKKTIQRDTAVFDLVVYEKLKQDRLKAEELKGSMEAAIITRDFNRIYQIVSQIGDYFKIEIPYKSSRQFVEYVRANERILIGN